MNAVKHKNAQTKVLRIGEEIREKRQAHLEYWGEYREIKLELVKRYVQ